MGQRGPKKGQRFGGRQKGTLNKLPRDLKLRILAVWNRLEEENRGLYEEAAKDPKWFFSNMIKPMLPKNVTFNDDEQSAITINMNRTMSFEEASQIYLSELDDKNLTR